MARHTSIPFGLVCFTDVMRCVGVLWRTHSYRIIRSERDNERERNKVYVDFKEKIL